MTMTHTSMRKLLSGVVLAVSAVSCKQADIDITNPNVALAGAVATRPHGAAAARHGTHGRPARYASGHDHEHRNVRSRDVHAHAERRTQHHELPRGNHRGRRAEARSGRLRERQLGAVNTAPSATSTTSRTRSTPALALTAAQKSAALGFAETLEALMLFEIVQTRDTLGGIIEIKENPFDLAPFVTRDSMYKYVLNTLDAAARSWRPAARRFRSRSRRVRRGCRGALQHDRWLRPVQSRPSRRRPPRTTRRRAVAPRRGRRLSRRSLRRS